MPGRRKPDLVWAAEQKAGNVGLGRAIAGLREKAGLSRAELARRSDDLAPESLAAIERGDVEAQWGTLRAIAAALGVELDSLFRLGIELAPSRAGERLREREREAQTATLDEGERT